MPWTQLPTPLRLLLLTALYSSTASAMPASRIFTRADTCGADRVSCKSDLTDLFCCPKDYSCILLAGDTSAMCCPAGRNCDEVRPITCDLRGQDITKYPKAPVMTIITNLDLEKCGANCCPFGYSCEGESKCVLNKDQSSIPKGAEYPGGGSSSGVPSGTAPTNTIETASATAEPTSTSEPSKASEGNQDQDPEEDKKKDDSSPATTSIVGGVVGGCIILLIIAVVVFLYFRRQKRREGGGGNEKGHHHHHFYGGGNSTSSSEASFGNIISEPIVQPNSYRADFILKTPSQNSQMTGPGSSTAGSSTLLQKSQFSGSSSSVPQQRQYSFSPTPTRVPQAPPRIRISIPNPFDSPTSSPHHQSAQMSSPIDDQSVRHGTVRLPPIRAMKGSSHCSRRPGSPEQLQREPSCESINVFADPSDVVKPRRLTRGTTFTDLMDEADLRGVGRGKAYAPGTNPHVPGTTPRI